MILRVNVKGGAVLLPRSLDNTSSMDNVMYNGCFVTLLDLSMLLTGFDSTSTSIEASNDS